MVPVSFTRSDRPEAVGEEDQQGRERNRSHSDDRISRPGRAIRFGQPPASHEIDPHGRQQAEHRRERLEQRPQPLPSGMVARSALTLAVALAGSTGAFAADEEEVTLETIKVKDRTIDTNPYADTQSHANADRIANSNACV
mgnify:CR=1 FL=1